MSNDLAIQDKMYPVIPDDVQDEMQNIRVFSSFILPYIKLVQSGKLTAPPYKMQNGSFAVCSTGVEPINIGESFTAFPLALRIKGVKSGPETTICSFSPKTLEHQDIKSKALELGINKDEKGFQYMWGPEYLLYVYDLGKLCTYHAYSKTAQSEVTAKLFPILGVKGAAKFSSRYIDNPRGKAKVPYYQLTIEESPVEVDLSGVPSEELEKVILTFTNRATIKTENAEAVKEEVER